VENVLRKLYSHIGKGKCDVDNIHIAPTPSRETSNGPGIDHTVLQTPCLPLPRKCSPDDATIDCGRSI